MTNNKVFDDTCKGKYYEIRVKDHLEEHWSEWLGGLKIIHEDDGNSLLTGAIPDQAALHGILAQIRDLGLTLISLTLQSADEDENQGADEAFDENTEREFKKTYKVRI